MNNILLKKEIKQNNSIYNSIKKNKMLKNKFIQEGKKSSIQNIAEKKLNTELNGKISHLWTRRLKIAIMSILAKVIHKFNTIPTKILIEFLTLNRKKKKP